MKSKFTHPFPDHVISVGVMFNGITQAPPDVDHPLTYGLIKETLERIMQTVSAPKRDKAKRILLDRRLAAFKYPTGWERFTFNLLRTVGARHSMELFRRAGTVCIHIFHGI